MQDFPRNLVEILQANPDGGVAAYRCQSAGDHLAGGCHCLNLAGVFSSTTRGTSDLYRDFYTGISITVMVRPILTQHQRERGRLLGGALRAARGTRSMVDLSAAAGIPVETLRKIETGRIVTPAFFTVAALAHALELDLGALAVLTIEVGVLVDLETVDADPTDSARV
jgi:hypothetical protein